MRAGPALQASHRIPDPQVIPMSLVEHARRELELCGQAAEDPGYAASIIAAVAAFASYGHSGGSASIASEQLQRLVRGEVLSPLTDDPEEWEDRSEISGYPVWQNRRDSRAMSNDGGRTWWYVEGRHAGERCKDGGSWGVLEKCRECGDGLLHRPDELPPAPEPVEDAAAVR